MCMYVCLYTEDDSGKVEWFNCDFRTKVLTEYIPDDD
jgi:hypothetical protein